MAKSATRIWSPCIERYTPTIHNDDSSIDEERWLASVGDAPETNEEIGEDGDSRKPGVTSRKKPRSRSHKSRSNRRIEAGLRASFLSVTGRREQMARLCARRYLVAIVGKCQRNFYSAVIERTRGIRRRDPSIVDSFTVEPFVSCAVYVEIFYYCT